MTAPTHSCLFKLLMYVYSAGSPALRLCGSLSHSQEAVEFLVFPDYSSVNAAFSVLSKCRAALQGKGF